VSELSLRELARSLGVSPRAPYRHFATKEELLAAVAVEGYRMWRSFVASRIEGAKEPAARLRIVVEAYVLFAVDHPAAFRVMYAPHATVEESAPDLARVRAEGHAEMLGLIGDAQKSGEIRAGDPMQLALGLWSTMHGLAVLLVEGQLGRYDRPVERRSWRASWRSSSSRGCCEGRGEPAGRNAGIARAVHEVFRDEHRPPAERAIPAISRLLRTNR
jgi:AcrR family transcriptional regulator